MLLEDLAVGPGEDGGITTSGFLAANARLCHGQDLGDRMPILDVHASRVRAGWKIDAGMARAVAC